MPAESGLRCDAPHVVLLPINEKGHLTPMMVLAKKLQRAGLFVSMILTEPETREYVRKTWDSVSKDPELESNPVQLLLLERQQHSSKSEALESLLESLKSSNRPPRAIVEDIIVMWSKEAIERSKIPKYVLYTASCAYLSVMFGVKSAPQTLEPDEEKAAFQTGLEDPEMPDFETHDWRQDLSTAEAVLVNSSYELEGREIDFLQEQTKKLVLPIGPLLPPPQLDAKNTGSEFSAGRQWLDEQAESSVIFISFGSRTFLQKQQIVELANGLARSKRPFLWVLPIPPSHESGNAEEYLDSVLPEGFRGQEQAGIIVCNWAPQKLILSHRSLGAFVTHCGWNSIIECLALGGKPMLCWPFGTDQPANSRLLVEELGVALEAEKDESGIVRSSEIEGKIQALLVDKRQEMEPKLAQLQQILNRTAGESSMKNVNRLAEVIANSAKYV